MQNDFITGALANLDAAKIVPGIVEEILSGKYDFVYVTADVHEKEKYPKTSEGKHLPIEHCVAGTEGMQIQEEIRKTLYNRKDVAVIMKDTFGSLRLAEQIKKHSILTVEPNDDIINVTLVGTCTDICVISNALILKTIPNAEVNVIEHLCAGTTPENHKIAIKAMKQCHVNIL